MQSSVKNASRAEPPACTLFMASRCNLKCAWCRRAKIGVRETPPMTLAVLQRLLDQYPDIPVFAMAGQGEPLLAPEFSPIVRRLAGLGKRLILDTNGVYSEPLRDLKGCFTRISLSLYGYSDDTYRAYAGVAAFDAVMASYELFQEVCAEVCISYIVDKDNLTDLENVLRLCDSLRPARLLLYNPLCYDDADKAQLGKIITAQDQDIIKRIERMASGRAYAADLPPYPDFSAPLNSCRSYCAVINIDGAGDIGGCLRKVIPDGKYGNVFSDSDCFNTAEMMRLRRRQLVNYPPHPECASCFGNWGYGGYRALSWRKDFVRGACAKQKEQAQ